VACLNDSKTRSAHVDYQKTNNVWKIKRGVVVRKMGLKSILGEEECHDDLISQSSYKTISLEA